MHGCTSTARGLRARFTPPERLRPRLRRHHYPDGFAPSVFTDQAGDSGHLGVTECGDTVVSVYEEWENPSGSFISIARRASPPVIGVPYTTDRLEPTTINGRPAIIVKPRFADERVAIDMRDSGSLWGITATGVDIDTLIHVAAGID